MVPKVDTADLGFPIGLDENIAEFIDQTTIRFSSGDGVVLYTDGITEAEDETGEQYSLERLCEIARGNWKQPSYHFDLEMILFPSPNLSPLERNSQFL